MVGFVRAKESVHPHILDDSVMHGLFKGGVFGFILCGRTNKWILFCESRL